MGHIEKDILKTLKLESKRFKNDPNIAKFDKASKEFSDLIDKGIAQPRGNQQMPVDRFHLKTYSFNTSQ